MWLLQLSFAWANMKICAPRLLFLLVFILFVFLCTLYNEAGTGQSDKYLWEDLIHYHSHSWHISLLGQTAALASGLCLRVQRTAYYRESRRGSRDPVLGSICDLDCFRVSLRSMRGKTKPYTTLWIIGFWLRLG